MTLSIMVKKSFLSTLLLLAAWTQTLWGQKVVLNKTDGSYITCKVSELQSIDFYEAGAWLVKKIELSDSAVTLKPDEVKALTASVLPEDADNKTVVWESSNDDVAEVTKSGKINANANGTCTITCRATDGSNVKAECHVTVTDITFVTSITLNHTSLSFTLPDNASQTLTASVQPDDATNKSVSWSSSKTSVATVSQAGKVTAVGEGTCTITCSAVDGGGAKAECQVTVSKATQGTTNGHEWVDLGLPSGTLWATCNVGASSPSGYGNYYAWGETSTKTKYAWSTYNYYYSSTQTCRDLGTDISGTSYDVAYVIWGSGWRMPTRAEYEELIWNCYASWTTKSGTKGYEFTGPNGKSIFLPASGSYDWDDSFAGSQPQCQNKGEQGFYWSATGYNADKWAVSIGFMNPSLTGYGTTYPSVVAAQRHRGLPVRAVRK